MSNIGVNPITRNRISRYAASRGMKMYAMAHAALVAFEGLNAQQRDECIRAASTELIAGGGVNDGTDSPSVAA